MDRLLFPGRIMYAISMLTLGVLCIQYGDFIVGRPPAWPEGLTVNPILGYVSGSVLVVAALLLLLNRYSALAGLVMAIQLLLFSVSRHLPQFMLDWVNAYKSLAFVGSSLVIAGIFANLSSPHRYLSLGERSAGFLVRVGSGLLSIFFIACGYAHFKWADGVQYVVPAFIPFRLFWTYLTGSCLLAGGMGLMIPRIRKWAAFMLGLMVFGWLVLLHLPGFFATPADYNARVGSCEALAFAGICWTLAAHFSADRSRSGK